MILDNTLVLSDSQAITASAASTNQIDLGAAGTTFLGGTVRRDVGDGTDIPVLVTVTQTFNNLTSLTVALQTDDDAAFGSPQTVATGPAIPLANLTAGSQINWPARLPLGTNERYVRLFYTVTGTAPAAGKITAAVVAGRQSN